MQEEVRTAGDLGASNLRLQTKVGGNAPAFEWSTETARYKGQRRWLSLALRDYREATGAPVPDRVGLTWPGYTNPVISEHHMTNPPRLVLDRDAFESETGIRLIILHDGAAHLVSTLIPEEEGGAQVLRNIFGIQDEEIEGAAIALDAPGSGVALSRVIYDKVEGFVRTVVANGESMHTGIAVSPKGWTEFDHEVLWELIKLAEEGAFADISPEGNVSPDSVLSGRGMRPLHLAVQRVLRKRARLNLGALLDLQPEQITVPGVMAAFIADQARSSEDPRVVTVRTWYDWHGDLCQREVTGYNAFGGLVAAGLIAKFGPETLLASGLHRRMVSGHHADKVGKTKVHLLTDPDSGIKGAFAAMELMA